jgi:flavorubredoxin
MSPETPLVPGIWRMTSNLDNEDVPLYEGQYPIPHGIALHAYLVRGDKTLLVDPYFEGGYGLDEVAEDLEVLGLSWKDVHFVALTREIDGLREALAALSPAPMVIEAGAEPVELGQSRRVEFLPGMLREASSGVLFSGRNWAGFGTVDEAVLSTEVNGDEARFFDDEALRWWMIHPDSAPVLPSGVTFVAPSHGLLWPNPAVLTDRAEAWKSWSGPAENEITLVWDDNPAADEVVGELLSALSKPGIDLNIFRVPEDHESFVRAALWRSSAVVLGPGVDPLLLRGMNKKVWRPEGTDLTSGTDLRRAAAEFLNSLFMITLEP